MSYFSELKVRHPDNKFIFYPVLLLIVLVVSLYLIYGISIAMMVGVALALLITLATVFHTYRGIIEEIRFQDQRTQAMFNIYGLVKPRLPLPYLSGWAAFPELISTIIGEVLKNKPAHIVELGSGSSTIITSYVLEDLGSGKISSFDHDEQYGGVTRTRLENHKLSDFATVIPAPLKSIQIEGNSYNWYDINLDDITTPIDMIVVDGPPEKTQKHARFPALPYLYEKLSEKAVVILDDAGRKEESEIVEKWLTMYPEFTHEYVYTEKGISILRRG